MKLSQKRHAVCMEALKQYPKHGLRTLAKAVYRRHFELWDDEDGAYKTFQLLTGSHGKKDRVYQKIEHSTATEPVMPVSRAKKWVPEVIDTRKLVILSDLHVPYHDESAITAAVESAKRMQPDTILLNGDLCDMSAIGFWEKDPAEKDFAGELKAVREFLVYLRAVFPKVRLILKIGNHEERFFSYMWRKAPEMSEVFSDMHSLLHGDKVGLEVVGDKRIIQAGKLAILHGHEYGKGNNPVGAARWAFLKGGEIVVIGHFHRTSEFSFTSAHDKLTTCWSTGCLCTLAPDWLPINQWNHGFVECEIDKDGMFNLRNKRIRHGVIL